MTTFFERWDVDVWDRAFEAKALWRTRAELAWKRFEEKQRHSRKWVSVKFLVAHLEEAGGFHRAAGAIYKSLGESILRGDFTDLKGILILRFNLYPPETLQSPAEVEDYRVTGRLQRADLMDVSLNIAAPETFEPTLELCWIPYHLVRKWSADRKLKLPAVLLSKKAKVAPRSKKPGGKKAGRPRAYRWDLLSLRVQEWLANNGYPRPGDGEQAKLEAYVRDWFSDEAPAESTIRKFVGEEIEKYKASIGEADN